MNKTWQDERKEIAVWLSGYLAMVKKWVDKILDNDVHDVSKNQILAELDRWIDYLQEVIKNTGGLGPSHGVSMNTIDYWVDQGLVSREEETEFRHRLGYVPNQPTHSTLRQERRDWKYDLKGNVNQEYGTVWHMPEQGWEGGYLE